jgi:hypothetical protein
VWKSWKLASSNWQAHESYQSLCSESSQSAKTINHPPATGKERSVDDYFSGRPHDTDDGRAESPQEMPVTQSHRSQPEGDVGPASRELGHRPLCRGVDECCTNPAVDPVTAEPPRREVHTAGDLAEPTRVRVSEF